MFETAWHDSGSIAVLRLNRPPANALGFQEIEDLDSKLERLSVTPTLRAIVFHSTLRFFSGGADIALMGEISDLPDGPEKLARLSAQMQATFARLEALPIATFCAISGICVGGGLELALACDFRIAEKSATVGLPEIKIGLLPGAGGTQRLTRVAGVDAARRLILTGELISGTEAHRLGIVQDLVAPGTALESAPTLARSVNEAPRSAVAAIKRCLALAPSPEGYAAEVAETLVLHREQETKARIHGFLSRHGRRKAAI